jgi:type IV pilus assembly protein PilC
LPQGEAGGILDTILKRLATYIEKAVKLKNQVQSGDDLPGGDRRHRHGRRRRHPLEGHPDLRQPVRGPGRRPAAPTRVVIALSNGLVRFMPFVIAGIFAFVFGLRAYYNTPAGA